MLKKINNEDAINERDIMKNIKWLKKSNLFVFLALTPNTYAADSYLVYVLNMEYG